MSHAQDSCLELLKNQNAEVTIFTTNGVRLVGFISDFDQYVVLIGSQEHGKQMIYKHAISTVQPVTE